MAKKSRKSRTVKSVTGPKPIKPVKSETLRKAEELARKAKIAGRALSAGEAKTARAARAAKIGGKVGILPTVLATGILARARRVKAESTKIIRRLERGDKALSTEFKNWIEESPELTSRTRGLGMAVKPKVRIAARAKSPIRARISDIIAGQQVQSRLAVQRAADKARRAITSDLLGIRKVAAVVAATAETAIARAKETLVGVTARVFKGIATGQLFDVPIEDLRKKFDPRIIKQTPEARKMIGVSSSNVFSAGFEPNENDPNTGTMFVQFRNGWAYKYKDAPRWLYEGLLSAASPGRYVWQNIRYGLYPDGTPYGSLARDGYTRIQ